MRLDQSEVERVIARYCDVRPCDVVAGDRNPKTSSRVMLLTPRHTHSSPAAALAYAPCIEARQRLVSVARDADMATSRQPQQHPRSGSRLTGT
jgi:hypothetical protein